MSGEKRNAVIILGMHRSGTSALAGCLNQLGVKMGSTLVPGDVSNELGYFEHADIVLAHDILLNDLGCRWDMVGNLPQGWLESKATQRAKKNLLAIITREFKGTRLWAVKDPRMCRLMPLWFEILTEIDTRPKFILMVRHPFEVARSLLKRDHMDLLTGHLLWMTHNREALAACRGHDHALLTYDQLLADPVRSLESISRCLNVTWPRTLRVHYQKILSLIQPNLKHEHPIEAGNDQETLSCFSVLYEQLRMQQVSMDTFAKAPCESDAVSAQNLASDSDASFFPLATPGTQRVSDPRADPPVAGIMSNLLGLIGKYEQIELGRALLLENRLRAAGHQYGHLVAQIFFPQIDGEGEEYTEERSHKVLLVPGEWQKIVIEVHGLEALRQKRLRLDPLGSIGMVAISAINLVNSANSTILWSATAENGFAGCLWEGDALLISKADTLVLAATGQDPRLLLPIMAELPDVPLRLEVWIKAERDLNGLIEAWQQREGSLTNQSRRLAELDHRLQQSETERDEAAHKVQELQAQLLDKEAILSTLKAEILVHIQKYSECSGQTEGMEG